MSQEKINQLIIKYNNGQLAADEEVLLEQYIEQGLIDLDDLEDLRQINRGLDIVLDQHPEIKVHEQFKTMLREEVSNNKSTKVAEGSFWDRLFGTSVGFRWAYSLGLVLLGLTIGWVVNSSNSTSSDEIAELSDKLGEMREMMVLSMLEKESTSERIKAVNLTRDMSDINEKITSALLQTLNQDKNVNVRLTTLEALAPYADHPQVRMGLIQAIQHQEHPIVQMALAEMMVSLQEKRSVNALKGLLDKEELPEEAKEKIKESVEVLL